MPSLRRRCRKGDIELRVYEVVHVRVHHRVRQSQLENGRHARRRHFLQTRTRLVIHYAKPGTLWPYQLSKLKI